MHHHIKARAIATLRT